MNEYMNVCPVMLYPCPNREKITEENEITVSG